MTPVQIFPFSFPQSSVFHPTIPTPTNRPILKSQIRLDTTPHRFSFATPFSIPGSYIDNWMETYTGKPLHYLHPCRSEICIEDICHHLASNKRFCGAAKYEWSVGQHCLFMYALVNKLIPVETTVKKGDPTQHGVYVTEYTPLPAFFSPDLRVVASVFATLHDAHEAYTGDFTTAFKQFFQPLIGNIETTLQWAIHSYFCIPDEGTLFNGVLPNHRALGNPEDLPVVTMQPNNPLSYRRHLKNLDLWILQLEAKQLMTSEGRYFLTGTNQSIPGLPWQCFDNMFVPFNFSAAQGDAITAAFHAIRSMTLGQVAITLQHCIIRSVGDLQQRLSLDRAHNFGKVLRETEVNDFLSTGIFQVRFREDGDWYNAIDYTRGKVEELQRTPQDNATTASGQTCDVCEDACVASPLPSRTGTPAPQRKLKRILRLGGVVDVIRKDGVTAPIAAKFFDPAYYLHNTPMLASDLDEYTHGDSHPPEPDFDKPDFDRPKAEAEAEIDIKAFLRP